MSTTKHFLTQRLLFLALLLVATLGQPAHALVDASENLSQGKNPTVVQKVQKQGDPVEFLLPTLDGSSLDAEQLRGKAVLLCFVTHGSPLIRPLLRQMNTIADSYPQVTLCLVFTNGTQPRDRDFISDSDLKTWRDQLHLPYPVARDPRGTLLFQRLDLSVLPSFVLLRKNGTVAVKREGLDLTTSLAEQMRVDLLRVVQPD
ncbi:MAG: TlpA family protein disulfide reductase [Acidobacteriota bacterium]